MFAAERLALLPLPMAPFRNSTKRISWMAA
jgi:hypothetical protein